MPEGKCNYKGCVRKLRAMGLCHYHYNMAVRLITEGKVTKEELLEAGRLQPARSQHEEDAREWFLEAKEIAARKRKEKGAKK